MEFMKCLVEKLTIEELFSEQEKLEAESINSEIRNMSIDSHLYLQGRIDSFGLFVSEKDYSKSILVLGIEIDKKDVVEGEDKNNYKKKVNFALVFSLFIPFIMNLASLFYLMKAIKSKQISLVASMFIFMINVILISVQLSIILKII